MTPPVVAVAVIDPALGEQLVNIGAIGLLLLTWAGLAVGALRKWIVMGWTYDQLLEDYKALRSDWAILRDQGDRNSKAIESLANERDRGARGGR